jgi:hypothetical protein
MKVAVFWYVAPYSLAEIDRRFRGAYCLHHQGDKAASICETTRRNIPEDSRLHSNSISHAAADLGADAPPLGLINYTIIF